MYGSSEVVKCGLGVLDGCWPNVPKERGRRDFLGFLLNEGEIELGWGNL